MNINFPLVLVVVCGLGLAIWLWDRFILAPQRKKRVAEFIAANPDTDFSSVEEGSPEFVSLKAVAREPVAVEWTKSLLPVLLVVLVLRSFLYEPFKIPSSSMEPTLLVGDYILVNKYTYGIRLPVSRTKLFDINQPERGDVMVFFPPGDKRYFIKRVIGLPGDRIEYRNKRLYINGEVAPQQFLAALPPQNPQIHVALENLDGVEHKILKFLGATTSPLRPKAENFLEVVPEGHYFMMGDNRDNSSDSRVWGSVPEANIVGKAEYIWMHWESLGSLPGFSRTGAIR